MENTKVFFIGAGMMAEGIIKGLVNDGIIEADKISVFDIIESRMQYLKQTYGINYFKEVNAGIKSSDIIVVAVKPQDMKEVLASLNENLNSIVVSIAAGVKIKDIQKTVGEDRKIVRIMPNPLVESKCGVSAICWNKNVSKEESEFVEKMMKSIGDTVVLKESLFDAFTGYCCSGGAYVYEFIEAMIDAGVLVGFSRNQAVQFTLQNIMGTAKMVMETKSHPTLLKERMTSPAGTTINGLHVLNKNGFKGIIQNCVEKAVERAEALK